MSDKVEMIVPMDDVEAALRFQDIALRHDRVACADSLAGKRNSEGAHARCAVCDLLAIIDYMRVSGQGHLATS